MIATPIYDELLAAWKGTHDGREPGDVLIEDQPKPAPRPRAPRGKSAPRGKRR